MQWDVVGAKRPLVRVARCAPTVVHSMVVQLSGGASGGKDASEEKEWASTRGVAMARVEPSNAIATSIHYLGRHDRRKDSK